MKKTIYFFLTAVVASSVLGALFQNPLVYAAGVAVAVALWGGLSTIYFEKTLKAIPWMLLAVALPFLYSFGWTREFPGAAPLVITFVAAFFEEIGWRGFLFKELEKFGWLKMNLIIGLMWAVWHLPAILTNNYPIASPFGVGLLFFFVNVILLSFLFGWFRQKTGGLWAPVLLHTFHNLIYGSNEGNWKFSLILIVILLIFQIWKKPITV